MALVDLFCGAGGFSLGAHRAGYRVAAAFDIDPILTSSFRTNFPRTELVLSDVSKLTGGNIRRVVGGQIEGVFGGPPCQGFSDIGRRAKDDPRRALLHHFFRLVGELRPRFFVMENVKGLAYHDAKVVLDDAIKFVENEYDLLGPILLDAADFGAATKRRRLFVIGIAKSIGSPFTLDEIDQHRRPAATVRNAIADLENATFRGNSNGFDQWQIRKRGPPFAYSRRLRADDGLFTSHRIIEHRRDVADRFSLVKPGEIEKVGRHPRLSWDGQCPTLRAGTGSDRGSYQAVRPLHPEQPRVITVREAARLQGFPDGHLFHPATWHSFRMIGNSVSPIIAEAIFSAIAIKMRTSGANGLAA